MNIVSTQLPARYNGLFEASATVFDKAQMIDKSTAWYDVFDDVKPDVVFIGPSYMHSSFIRLCDEFSVKKVLFNAGVPEGVNPDVVCIPPSTPKPILNNIESDEYTVLNVKEFADTNRFMTGIKENHLACDVSFLSVTNNVDEVSICSTLSQIRNKKFKVFGNQVASSSNYIGQITKEEIGSLCRSSKIIVCPTFDNVLNIAINGGFCLCATPNSLYSGYTKDNMRHLIARYDKTLRRAKLAKEAKDKVLSCDTVYHRLIDITEALGMNDCSEKIVNIIEEIKIK